MISAGTKLLEQAGAIPAAPLLPFRYPAVRYSLQPDACPLHAPAGGLHAEEGVPVSTPGPPTGGDQIALRDLLLDVQLQIGKCAADELGETPLVLGVRGLEQ